LLLNRKKNNVQQSTGPNAPQTAMAPENRYSNYPPQNISYNNPPGNMASCYVPEKSAMVTTQVYPVPPMSQGYPNSVPQQDFTTQDQSHQYGQNPQGNSQVYTEARNRDIPGPAGNAVELESSQPQATPQAPHTVELESPVGSPPPRYGQFPQGP
jgi:hypothetical protein